MNIEQYIFSFFVYAFLGYLCEVAYCSLCQRHLVNRGYLYMPICPIYGFGAILIILTMNPIIDMWYLVLILGILLTSALEYLTSYLMELIFHMRWWDYSQRKCNINGRVCLRNSLMFGALVMLVMYVLVPFVQKIMNQIGSVGIWVIDGILLVGFIIDFIFSTIKNINIAKLVGKISELTEEASDKLKELKTNVAEKIHETKDYISNTTIALKLKELISKYPNVSFRKVGKGKKRLSIKEFISKHLDEKDEK
ncbi:hypothetical protein HDR67_02785 [bacterium]|nr:hypothetical protein [bacterium]